MVTNVTARFSVLPLNTLLTTSAVSSWISSTRRLLKTCRSSFPYRARFRHGSIIYTSRRKPLPAAYIVQDIFTELEADQLLPVSSASSRGPAPGNEPSLSSARGRPVSIDSAPGFLFPRLSDTGVSSVPGTSIKAPQGVNAPNVIPCGAGISKGV